MSLISIMTSEHIDALFFFSLTGGYKDFFAAVMPPPHLVFITVLEQIFPICLIVGYAKLWEKCVNVIRNFFFSWRYNPIGGCIFTALQRALASSLARFLDHIQRRAKVGRTPLNEWSVRRRDLYLTTHNTHNRQTSMPRVGFEPTIAAGEQPNTYVLDRAATGTGVIRNYVQKHCQVVRINQLYLTLWRCVIYFLWPKEPYL